jgi:hypothetical protein
MKRTRLETLRVVSPCLEGWDRMTGDDRTRHCQRCEKNVFDVSQLSRDEAERLLKRTNGDLCVRLKRRPDGSIVTRVSDPVAPVVPIRLRRAGPVAGAALGLVLGVSGAAYAQEPIENQPVADKPAVVALASKDEVTQTDGAFASVTGTIVGKGSVPAAARLSLVEASTGKFLNTQTSENGEYSFTNIPAGDYYLFIAVEHSYPLVKHRFLSPGQVWQFNTLINRPEIEIMGVSGEDRSEKPFSLLRHTDVVAYAKIVEMNEISSEKYESENGKPPVEFVNWQMTVKFRHVLKGKAVPGYLTFEQSFFRHETPQPKPGDEVLLFLERDGDEWRRDTFVQLDGKFQGAPRLAEFIQRTRKRTPTRAEFTEWLVQDTINPETREDASFELWDEFPEKHATSDSRSDCPEDPTPRDLEEEIRFQERCRHDPFCLSSARPNFLNESQKERLVQALFNTETLDERDENLLRMVEKFHHPKLTPFLVNQLRDQLGVPSRFSERIFEFLGKSSRDERIRQFAELYRLLAELRFNALYPELPNREDAEWSEDKEKTLTDTRERARNQLRAVIRAALWAYDHPETP